KSSAAVTTRVGLSKPMRLRQLKGRSGLLIARCSIAMDVRGSSSLMALPSAGNETVGCPQRGERIATGEHEAANAGLRQRGLERARPAGEQEHGAGVPQRLRGCDRLARIDRVRRA